MRLAGLNGFIEGVNGFFSTWRITLSATTALLSFALSIGTASAQQIIDGGTTETVPGGSQGASWNIGAGLIVGSTGAGTLTIDAGGTVTNTTGVIGDNSGSIGDVSVSGPGASWTNSGFLIVGGGGTGTLTIGAGGNVTSSGASVGNSTDPDSAVTVSGAGAIWTDNGELRVGDDGIGALTISSGGSVTSDRSWIGLNGGSDGTVTVTNTGSTWAADILSVGENGNGVLNISDGGQVTSAQTFIGGATRGSAFVSTGSLWTMNGDLQIGGGLDALLEISDGGTVNTTGTALLGEVALSTGIVRVTGSGASWTTGSDIYVGGDVLGAGDGILTVTDGGTVIANSANGTVFVGLGPGGTGSYLSIGGEVSSAAGPSAAAAPGNLDAATVQLGLNSDLNFNHTSSNYTFAPVITGSGTVNHLAGTTIFTADSSAFSGTFNLSGGTVIVNGVMGGNIDVDTNGRLGGTGTISGADLQGRIAPGNSIGTLNVGSITFETSSIYEVEVDDAGQSDQIAATGTVTINGGTVEVLAGAGNYAPSTTYTILTAASGVNGAFDGVTSNLAFLDPSLSSDTNNIYLTLQLNGTGFADVGVTPNQIATGGGVDSLGSGPLYDAVLNLSAPQARDAFDQLSGEIHPSIKSVLLVDSRFPREAALNRLRAAFGGAGASTAPVATYTDSGAVSAAPDTDRFAVWGQGFGSWGQWDGDGNAAELDRSTGGFLVGGDGRLFDSLRLGAFAGYSYTSFDVDERQSSGSSDNIHLGLYGGTQWGHLVLRSGLAYTWNDISTDRNVTFPGFGEKIEGNYDAGTAQAFGELGYGIDVGPVALEPFANLAYVNLSTDGFSETGGDAALKSKSADDDATFTTLGLHGSGGFMIGGLDLTAKGSLGWRHVFGDTTPSSTFAFVGGDSFNIEGVPIARDAAVVDLGLDLNLSPGAAVGLSYGGQYGSDFNDQTVRANLGVKF